MHRLLVLVAVGACAGNAGRPHYRNSAPPAIAKAASPRASDSVRVVMKVLPWWALIGDELFVLRFDVPAESIAGETIGPVRSPDVAITDEVLEAARCAWNDDERCSGLTIERAGATAKPWLDHARDGLRAEAAATGAGVVVDTRCFADRMPAPRFWCEGRAIAAEAPPESRDPTEPSEHAPFLPEQRFLLIADGSIGILNGQPIAGSTVGFRYHPFEVGFLMLDLSRTTLTPRDDGRFGLGLTALTRFRLGRSRADAILGAGALATAQNGATNPDIDGMYQAFVGIAYQTRWRMVSGTAQPWAQLRVGGAYTPAAADRPLSPLLELHIGFSTPERR